MPEIPGAGKQSVLVRDWESKELTPEAPEVPAGEHDWQDFEDAPATASLHRDVNWVYQNLFKDAPDMTTCPGGGAYWLWDQVKNQGGQNRFFDLLKHTLPSKDELLRESRYEDDGRKLLDRLERCLGDFQKEPKAVRDATGR